MSEAKIVLSGVDQTKAAFDAVKQNLAGLQTKAVAISGVLGGLGVTAYVATLAQDVLHAIGEWDELGKAAQRAGFQSAQGMAEFQFAAKLAGVDSAGMETAISKLNGKMAEAAGGSKEAAALFQALGIRVTDASGGLRGTEEVLTDLAGKFAGYRDGPEKAALATELFGKAGRELIPLLNGGADGLSKTREEFRALRGELSDGAIKASEQFNDNITKLEASTGKLARTLATPLLPALVAITDQMVEGSKRGGFFMGILSGLAAAVNVLTGAGKGGVGLFETKDLADKAQALKKIADEVDRLKDLRKAGKLGYEGEEQLRFVEGSLESEKAKYRAAYADYQVRRSGLYDVDSGDALSRRMAGANRLPSAPVPAKGGAGGASEDESRAIMNRVRERLAAQTSELAAGRALTEQEKFAIKVNDDLANTKAKLTTAQRAQIQATLGESAAAQQALDKRTRQLAMDKAIFEDQQQTQSELLAADAESAKSRDQYRLSLLAETNALVDVQTQMDLEGRLIGATDRERQIALEHLRIELKLRQDLDALNHNLNFDESQRDEERARLQANAAIAKAQVTQKANQDAEQDFVSDFRGDIRGALTRAFEDSKNPARAFIEAFASTLYTRVSGKLADALTDSLFKGAAGGGGGLGGLLSNMLGSVISGGSAAIPAGVPFTPATAADMAAIGLHSGGIAGQEHTFTRPVDPTVFRHAPRFHTGGVAGDEVPAVLRRGEGVFTPGQMKALGGSGDLKLTIINNTSAPIGKVHERRISANERALIIEETRQATVAALHNANSPESKALAGNFGLQRRR